MRALQHCDFCDSEAAGTFEVFPPELEPTDAEQQRVVLCPVCKDQLGTLLEPLLARLRGEPAVESDEGTDVSGTGERSGQDSENRDGSESENENKNKNESEAPSTTRGNEITFGDSKAVETAEASAAEAGETTESEPAAALEADREREPDTGTDTEPAGELEPVAATEPVTDAQPDTPATTGETGTTKASTATNTSEASTPSAPQAYPKVIRLLRNRELPMDRNAVESLAAGAYDLEAEQAEAIVDHALEQKEFTEQGGKLHRA